MIGRAELGEFAMAGRGEGEVLLEFQQVGNSVKVTAVDPVTMVEVSIVGDPAAGREALTRTAVRKLEYVLKRRKEKSDFRGL